MEPPALWIDAALIDVAQADGAAGVSKSQRGGCGGADKNSKTVVLLLIKVPS